MAQAEKSTTIDTPASASVYYDTYGHEFRLAQFSMKEIYNAIPAHCFERSASRSLGYVARDVTLITALAYSATFIPTIPGLYLRIVAWTAYVLVQGFIATGLWVLAHECGHQAFSSSRKLNDTVGFLLHSSLLVPYFSWKYTHARHHQKTGHLEKDNGYVPKSKSEKIKARGGGDDEKESHFTEMTEETPIMTAYALILQQMLGWPAYLLFYSSGTKYNDVSPFALNHFIPSSPLFKREQRNGVLASDIGLLIVLSILYHCAMRFGTSTVILFYVLPYLVVNHNVVMITCLQHTDPALPHYREDGWSFARGASATMDRDFGLIGRHVFHCILETHVCHHMASRIPFYNAEEATRHIAAVMGRDYRFDSTNIFVALWRNARMCQYVDDEKQVVFYQNANRIGNNSDGKMNTL